MAKKNWRLRTNESGWMVYDKIGQGTFSEVEVVTYDVPKERGNWIVFIAENGIRKKEKNFKSRTSALNHAKSYMRSH